MQTETLTADLLLEVVDVTSGQIAEHQRTTREVLAELGAGGKPVITVFNKVDLVTDKFAVPRLRRKHADAVFVSAKTGEGLEHFRGRLAEELAMSLQPVELLVPHDRYDVIALLHRTSHVSGEEHTDEGVRVSASVPRGVLSSVEEFWETNCI